MSSVECQKSGKPRVGHIRFFNCLPLYYGLVQHQVLGDVELTRGTPTELNSLQMQGKLDVSPISSIAYARHWQDLLIMPNLSVGCYGPVKSIYLVSKVPIQQLDGRTVALTSSSATSQVLLKIVLEDGYGAKPEYMESASDLKQMLGMADAALLIGDAALLVHFHKPAGLYTYDLGVEWCHLTGMKMVFALWAVRRSFAAAQPELVRKIYRSFVQAMAYSLENVEHIAKDAACGAIFDAAFLQDYFTTLQYDLDDKHRRGLLEYYARAQNLGYLAEVPALDFLEVEDL